MNPLDSFSMGGGMVPFICLGSRKIADGNSAHDNRIVQHPGGFYHQGVPWGTGAPAGDSKAQPAPPRPPQSSAPSLSNENLLPPAEALPPLEGPSQTEEVDQSRSLSSGQRSTKVAPAPAAPRTEKQVSFST